MSRPIRLPASPVVAGLLFALALAACSSSPHAGASDPAARLPTGPSAQRVRADVAQLVAFGTRHTQSDTRDEQRGIGAARRWLAEEFERISVQYHGGRLEVRSLAHQVPAGPRLPGGAEVVNVAAFLRGSDPTHLVVISGHYDSRNGNADDAVGDAPGANDDASGVAAVLEAARLLGGITPRASIVFLAVAGEEQGLLGSRAQAQAWKAEGLKVEAFLTNDIVGGATGSDGVRDPRRIRVFSEGLPSDGSKLVGSDNDAPSRQLARRVRELAGVPANAVGLEVRLIFRQDRYLRGGDHKSFNDIGVAAIRLTESHENFDQQHQDVRVEDGLEYGDLLKFVDFDYVARVARLNAACVRDLALAPRAPEGLRMDISELSPDTRLSWEPSPGAARYEVLMRRTSEPDWTSRKDIGAATSATLVGISKDDWLFGVCALSADGARSPAVYPRPAKK